VVLGQFEQDGHEGRCILAPEKSLKVLGRCSLHGLDTVG